MTGRQLEALPGTAIRFLLVSVLGVGLDLGLAAALMAGMHLSPRLAATAGLCAAVLLNYALHEKYTFARHHNTLSARRLGGFALNSLAVLGVRLAALELLLRVPMLASAAGGLPALVVAAGVSFVFSFVVSRLLIFRRR